MIWWDLRRTLRDIERAADRWRLVEAWWAPSRARRLRRPWRVALCAELGEPIPPVIRATLAEADDEGA